MAKSKNHTSHNQGYKNHRNGIHKALRQRSTGNHMVWIFLEGYSLGIIPTKQLPFKDWYSKNMRISFYWIHNEAY